MIKKSYIIIIIIMMISCQHHKSSIQKQTPVEGPQIDTLHTVIEDTLVPSLIDEYNLYTEAFANSYYETACPKIKLFVDTFADGDSLKYESEFLYCECLIYQKDVKGAKYRLLKLLSNPKTTDIIREKAIIRLGHIYCYESKFEDAEFYFDLLRSEYPDSKYIEAANCDILK